jgi:hypothetical protein
MSDLQYLGRFQLLDVLETSDDGKDAERALKIHDCRAKTYRDRTGRYLLVTIRNSDRDPVWVFDQMGPGCFLYVSKYCQYCGTELSAL